MMYACGMDWNKLISDIRACGFRLHDIADEVGMSKGGVHDLQNTPGKNVYYEPGAKIVALHKKLTPKLRKLGLVDDRHRRLKSAEVA